MLERVSSLRARSKRQRNETERWAQGALRAYQSGAYVLGAGLVGIVHRPVDSLRVLWRLLRWYVSRCPADSFPYVSESHERSAREARDALNTLDRSVLAESQDLLARTPDLLYWASILNLLLEDWIRFRRALELAPTNPLIVFFSGSPPMDKAINYRASQLARSVVGLRCPTIFVYHRWAAAIGGGRVGPENLVQLPMDFMEYFVDFVLLAGDRHPSKILWVTYPHPTAVEGLRRFQERGWKILYDCIDDWEAFNEVGMARWYDRDVEHSLIRQADLVTCVSGPLADKVRQVRPAGAHIVPNGYDPAFLAGTTVGRQTTGQVRVGYFGQLRRQWFDYDTLREVATLRPNFTFELVGPHRPADIELPDNVRLLRPVPRQALPEIAAQWSAAFICFLVGDLSDGVDPIKVYEYLALGLPVVSLRLPQIRDYPYTTLADSAPAFAAALDSAIATSVDMTRVSEWLSRNTWAVRVQDTLRRLGIELNAGSLPG